MAVTPGAIGAYQSTHSSSALLTVYLIRQFLDVLRNKLVFARWATMADIPLHAGHSTAKWTLPVDINTLATTAITEFGDAVQAATVTWTSYLATVSTYGIRAEISDMADASWLPQAKDKVADIFAYHAAKTIDTLHRNDIDDTTAFIVSGQLTNNTGTLATTDTMTAQDIVAVGGFFDEKDAVGFEEVGGDYVLAIHGRAAKQLQSHVNQGGATTGSKISWADMQSKTVPGQRKLQNYEIGTYAGVSIQKTNNMATDTFTNTVTAYIGLGISKGAYGRANLDMRNVRMVNIPASAIDKTDPLGLYGIVGWKARMAHRPLDVNNRAVKLYTGV